MLKETPLRFTALFCRATVTWTTAWPPAGMSMPVARSCRMTLAAVPVLVRFQLPPEITSAFTKLIPAAESPRLSRILTSYSGTSLGVAGTLTR